MNIANKLKEKRTAAGLSQSGLAVAAGVNVRLIQDYEQGHKDINRAAAETVYKLAKALGCSMEELLRI